ncbi:hypothetical protein GCM10007891_03290 [Methylophaga thalassica]|uniref:Uncharacterized protein n=1 Tax=Methylophaga thalassica TaxID=40223 RepID=A0ABQ5TRP1_9GAMM|nr:hypothetical protein [Methylophaga thalassica]GLP98475.1 hypothetical protein GCM10007891_03290 [Methylophaga thalassica]
MTNHSKLDEILQRLRKAEDDLAQELDRLVAEKRKQFHYTLRHGRIIFEKNVRNLQRKQRLGSWRYIKNAPWKVILSAPVIYGMIVPLVLLDLTITFYQQVCFRVYGIPRVKRSDYIAIDRHYLSYLNMVEKLNCVYCGYGNGLMSYAREITARTEQFWCPIKHARKLRDSHQRTARFFDYGDADAWRNNLKTLRENWDDDVPSPVRIIDPSNTHNSEKE